MSERPPIFAEEWRRCLRAHYQEIVQQGDSQNERSLLKILNRLGFSDAELQDLRASALGAVSENCDNQTKPAPILSANTPPPVISHDIESNHSAQKKEPADDADEKHEPEFTGEETDSVLDENPNIEQVDDENQLSLFN